MNVESLNRIRLFLGATGCILRSRFYKARPFFVSHLITTRCFAKCATCLWRGESTEEHDTGRIIDFYQQAQNLGFVSTTFWGGEPLLREDLVEILKACRRLGLVTGLITNGYLLPEYSHLLAHNLNFLIVSLDIPNHEHDRLRGVSGLFNNILIGLNQIMAENRHLKVFINAVISQLNYPYFEQLIHFAESLSLAITFESVNQGSVEFPRKDGNTKVELRLAQEREKAIFGRILELKNKHSSINNSKSYLRLFKTGNVKYRCHAPKISIRVEPDGSVTNCQDRTRPAGNVYQEKLTAILSSPQLKWLQKKAESCSSCVDSGVIESSLFWDFNVEVMANSLRLFLTNG